MKTAGLALLLSLALSPSTAPPPPPAPTPAAPSTPSTDTAASAELAPGIAMFDAGRFEDALAFFRAYSGSHPKSAAAAFYAGRSLFGLGRLDEALTWTEKAVALEPDNADLHRWLARVYARNAVESRTSIAKNRFAQEAKDQLDKAVKLDPNNIRVREDLIDFYLHSPEFLGGSVPRARQEAAEILKRDPVAGHMALADIHFALKETSEGIQEYDAAIRETPSDPRPRLALGALYQSQGRWTEAFDAFEALLQADPNRWDALYQVGKTGALSGQRLDRAEECLKRYLGHTPTGDDPPLGGAHFRLGMIRQKRGDVEGARREYEEAVKLSPDIEDARKALATLPPPAPAPPKPPGSR
jgi:tetratricopeptide (TPR) repeat protein